MMMHATRAVYVFPWCSCRDGRSGSPVSCLPNITPIYASHDYDVYMADREQEGREIPVLYVYVVGVYDVCMRRQYL
ncbi:hypothetical protein E2C01_001060 [Portunus trituberculatus]|uniref:Uncharacterized protein n=1 Tax=Portunus trituberculatus TaxID=210409 RepID=A0A5B7CFR5_PORTR|nr:hypothetical protein [Portunus trituberculatus]